MSSVLGFVYLCFRTYLGRTAPFVDMPRTWLKEKNKRGDLNTPLLKEGGKHTKKHSSDVAYILSAHISAQASHKVKWCGRGRIIHLLEEGANS